MNDNLSTSKPGSGFSHPETTTSDCWIIMAEGSLSQEEIDALLKGSDDTGGGGGAPAGGGGELDDLAALAGFGEDEPAAGGGGSAEPAGGGGGGGGADLAGLADLAGFDADMNEALSASLGPAPAPAARPAAPAAPAGGAFGSEISKQNLNLLMDVTMSFTVELGRTDMAVREINMLTEGIVVELDKNHGDPVDILINDKQIARGKIVVVDEFYGVQITEFLKSFEEMMKDLQR